MRNLRTDKLVPATVGEWHLELEYIMSVIKEINLICGRSSPLIRKRKKKAQQTVWGPKNYSWQEVIIVLGASANAQGQVQSQLQDLTYVALRSIKRSRCNYCILS